MAKREAHREAHKESEIGQSLVEVALVLPILLVILSGLVDLGRVYFTFVALEDAAAEGALYLSLFPDCPYSTTTLTDYTNIDWNNNGTLEAAAEEFDESTTYNSVVAPDCDDPNNALFRLRNTNNNDREIDFDRSGIQIDIRRPADGPNANFGIGDSVEVRIRYPFFPATPIISGIARDVGGINMSVSATRIIVNQES